MKNILVIVLAALMVGCGGIFVIKTEVLSTAEIASTPQVYRVAYDSECKNVKADTPSIFVYLKKGQIFAGGSVGGYKYLFGRGFTQEKRLPKHAIGIRINSDSRVGSSFFWYALVTPKGGFLLDNIHIINYNAADRAFTTHNRSPESSIFCETKNNMPLFKVVGAK